MHNQAPDKDTETRDQQRFDDAVNRKGKILLEWLGGAGVIAALVMSMVALVQSGNRSEATATAATIVKPAGASSAPQAPSAARPVDLKIIGSSKLGPDGKKHDAFTETEFAVKVGQPLELRIDNTDDVAHSITAPVAGLNILIQPGIHTYKLLVTQAGRFQWFCIIPCDTESHGWAMQNSGFMSGYITAT
jgi:plastocyanin